jgi:DNA polymerase-1
MSTNPERLLVIDGGYATHRAYHALAPSKLSRPDGEPIWALHGFFTSLAKLVAMRKPTHVLIALDSPGGCPARRAQLPGYKSTRKAPLPEFASQAKELEIVLHEAGIPSIALSGWEADDIVASAAVVANAAGMECDMFSADRDLFQLLNGTTRVVRIDGSTFTEDDLLAKYGCSPRQYVELAAMRGEAADCIEGVPRVGEKTAMKLLAAFGDFESAIADEVELARALSPKLAALVVEHADRVRTNISVATLRRDIEIRLGEFTLPLDRQRLETTLRAAGLPAAASAMCNTCC